MRPRRDRHTTRDVTGRATIVTAPHPGAAPAVHHYDDAAFRRAIASGQHLLDILGDVQTGRDLARTGIEHHPLAGRTATMLRGNDADIEGDLRSLIERVHDHIDAITAARSRATTRFENSLTDHQHWEHRYQQWRSSLDNDT